MDITFDNLREENVEFLEKMFIKMNRYDKCTQLWIKNLFHFIGSLDNAYVDTLVYKG